MKKILTTSVFLLLLALLVQPIKSFAADTKSASSLNYAVINVVYVMSQSKAVQGITKQVNAYREKLEKQAKIKQDELQQNQQDLVKKQSEMSPKDFEKAKQQFQTKVQNVQQEFYNKSQSLEKVREEALATIEKSIGSILDKIAKENNNEIIFQATSLARYSKDKDISEAVVAQLNKNTPSVNVKKPF